MHIEQRRALVQTPEKVSATSRIDYSGEKGILRRLRTIWETDQGVWWCVGCFDRRGIASNIIRASKNDTWIQDNGLEVETTSRKIEPQKNDAEGYLIFARLKDAWS